MQRFASRLRLVLCLLASFPTLCATAAEPAAATDKKPASKYLRLERDADGKLVSLQTAIVHFTPDKEGDATVDLVGAVHVGEKSYYEALNSEFEKYDVVLYELVAPPGTRVPKGGKSSGHPVALLQNGFKDMLQLEHQLEYIDYTKENLVHADMSAEDMSASMKNKGESFLGMFFRMMGMGIAQQADAQAKGKSFDADMMLALFDKNRAGGLKRAMAQQFEDLENTMQALEGPNGSTIITERNKVALEGLKKQIAGGKKHIAIFYGGGHMADMERRLVSGFGLHRAAERWLTAWTLTEKPAAGKPAAEKPAAEKPAAEKTQ